MTPLSSVGFILILRQNKTRRSGHALLELLLKFPALDCTQAKQGRAELWIRPVEMTAGATIVRH
jgi:hypothetical protein